MTNFTTSFPIFRRARFALLAGLAAGQVAMVMAAAPSPAVVSIQSTRVADLVLVGAGFEAGLRQGMVCRVTRGTVEIGEIQLVELRNRASTALILNLAPSQSIRSGDLVAVKLLKV
jgi:hypothetical protein